MFVFSHFFFFYFFLLLFFFFFFFFFFSSRRRHTRWTGTGVQTCALPILTQAKTVSNYTNSILANMEATDDGYDEALLLDASGFVSEGAGENLFMVKKGVVYTPDLSAGALDGITRNTILGICADLGLRLVEKRITRDELYIADKAFFTGTAAEVTPIRELDRLAIGSGARGPITEKIQSAFFDIVNGRNAKYAEWLVKV